MSELVAAEEIERIVGVARDDTEHYGRAVSSAKTVFILHSAQCKASTADLRDCAFSVALDRGIDHEVPWSRWRRAEDRAVLLELVDGWLLPRIDDYDHDSEAPFDDD